MPRGLETWTSLNIKTRTQYLRNMERLWATLEQHKKKTRASKGASAEDTKIDFVDTPEEEKDGKVYLFAHMDFLLAYRDVISAIENYKQKKGKKSGENYAITTIGGWFQSIKSVLKKGSEELKAQGVEDWNKYARVMEFYTDKMNQYRAKYEEWLETQELTPAEKEKWLPWSEVLKIPPLILDEYNTAMKSTSEKGCANTEHCWTLFQDYLIMCLYTMMPPKRRDYSPMEFIEHLPEGYILRKTETGRTSTRGSAITDLKNYCCLLLKDKKKQQKVKKTIKDEFAVPDAFEKDMSTIDRDAFDPEVKDEDYEVLFILNSYKTSWSYGRAEFYATPQLVSVIRKWREINLWNGAPCCAFLRMRSDINLSMTQEALGTRVGDLCEKYSVEHKHATINTLRHSYISEMRKNELSLLAKREMAESMLHNVYIAERYIRYTL